MHFFRYKNSIGAKIDISAIEDPQAMLFSIAQSIHMGVRCIWFPGAAYAALSAHPSLWQQAMRHMESKSVSYMVDTISEDMDFSGPFVGFVLSDAVKNANIPSSSCTLFLPLDRNMYQRIRESESALGSICQQFSSVHPFVSEDMPSEQTQFLIGEIASYQAHAISIDVSSISAYDSKKTVIENIMLTTLSE